MSVDRVGRFGLVGVLGSGGFGTVYDGIDTVSGERVAVKVLDRMGGSAVVVRSQLLAEVDALRSVVSVNTLRVVDVVDEGDVLALVTDFVVGTSLRTVLNSHGVLSGPDALTVLRGAGLGLAAVHGAGLVHGDVKPANILVGPDGVSKLIDFGLVSLPGWISEDSASPWGSPAYAPPEQVAHNFRDHRSDIYSLTVTLFEVLCGQRPFGGDTVDEVRSNHVHQALPDPRVFVPDLGDGLTQLLLWGLAKDPDARPQDVGTWLQYLEAAAEERYGPGWAAAASVGAIAGAAIAGGLLASGVLVGEGAAAIGAGVAASAAGGAAAGAVPGAGSAAGAASGAGGAGSASGGAEAGGVGAAKTGLLATGLAKSVAAVAVIATIAAGGVITKIVLDNQHSTTAPAVKKVLGWKAVKIAFSTCDEGDSINCKIVTVNPDGSDERELFEGFSPAWSPDGKRLAFLRSAEDRMSVWIVDVGNGEPQGRPRQIGTIGALRSFTEVLNWSSDSSMVGTGLAIVNLADNGSRPLPEDAFGLPSWSPDGKYIAYAFAPPDGGGSDSFAIRVVNSLNGESDVIAKSDSFNPVWSPRGDKISYIKSGRPWIMDPDGKRAQTAPVAASDRVVGWSPDGSALIVERCGVGNDPTACSLFAVDIDTRDETRVSDNLSDAEVGPFSIYWAKIQSDDEAGPDPAVAGPVSFDPELELDGNAKVIGDATKFDELPSDVKTFLRGYATSAFEECGSVKSEPAISVQGYDPEGFVEATDFGGSDCGSGAALQIWSKQGQAWESVAGGNGVPECKDLRAARVPDSFSLQCYEGADYDVYHR